MRHRTSVSAAFKNVLKWSSGGIACGFNSVLGSRAEVGFGILMYHRVADTVSGIDPPTWNTRPDSLREQLTGLLKKGFQPWPLRRVIEYHNLGKEVPPSVFVVTFDDGHESVYSNAWPILRRMGIPATVFLVTAFLDSQLPFPFDDWTGAGSPLAPIDTWRPLSSAQCREMLSGGQIELGAHTHTHQDFGNRPLEFEDDLRMNLDVLRSKFEIVNPVFSFPYGRVNPALVDVAKKCSTVCGLTTFGTTVRQHDPPQTWGRFAVEAWDTSQTLAAKLGGWYSYAPYVRKWLATMVHHENLW